NTSRRKRRRGQRDERQNRYSDPLPELRLQSLHLRPDRRASRRRGINTMSENTKSTFEEWALVELFGHSRIVGKVTEATIAGGAFIRVDVPDKDGNTVFTRFFGPGAIYSMSPI